MSAPVPLSLAEALAVPGDRLERHREGVPLALSQVLEWQEPRKITLTMEVGAVKAAEDLASSPGVPAVVTMEKPHFMPKKVEVPEEHLPGMVFRDSSDDEAPMTLGRVPKSMPISLSALVPLTTPPLAPGLSLSPVMLPTPPPSLPLQETVAKKDVSLMLPGKVLRWAPHAAAKQDAVLVEETPQGKAQFPPGLLPPPNTPSHGSALHGDGHCRPCAWFWKPVGCKNGADCGHCHLCPEGEIKNRKKTKQAVLRQVSGTPKMLDVDVPEFVPSPQVLMSLVAPMDFLAASPATTACPASDSDASDREENPEDDHKAGGRAMKPVPISLSASLAPPLLTSFTGAASPLSPMMVPTLSFAMSADAPCWSPMSAAEIKDSEAAESPICGSFPPGLQPPANTLSQGSALHKDGTCRPCAWFWKPGGCKNGSECCHCHLCPEGEIKARKKAKQTSLRVGY